jgi:hypothetical protein
MDTREDVSVASLTPDLRVADQRRREFAAKAAREYAAEQARVANRTSFDPSKVSIDSLFND